MSKIFDYLKQPSTWKGLVAVVTAFGVYLSPEQTAAIVTTGAAIFGLIEVFRNEKEEVK